MASHAFGVAVRDALTAMRRERQISKKCRGLGQRLVRMISGEHHPVHTDLQYGLEQCVGSSLIR